MIVFFMIRLQIEVTFLVSNFYLAEKARKKWEKRRRSSLLIEKELFHFFWSIEFCVFCGR